MSSPNPGDNNREYYKTKMKFLQSAKLLAWLPPLNGQVWLLAAGRLLSGIGSGFTLFYAPIFFADGVGLSKTDVGLALGSASISGVVGRVLSGQMADSPTWGRRNTLLLSNLICAVASLMFAATHDFPTLVLSNLLMGLGVGLYWPAAEAAIADLTTEHNRHEAFAITRLADTLGLQLGVVLAGVLISFSRAYRLLFALDAISYLIFFAAIWIAIAETYKPSLTDSQGKGEDTNHNTPRQNSWIAALSDRALLVYVAVNILFTTYICQISSTMPLYFTHFVSIGEGVKGFSAGTIGALFAGHLTLAVVLQLPVARFLKRFRHPQALTFSALLWGAGFLLTGVTGTAASHQLIWAILGLAVLAIAAVAYTPSASSLVGALAPESLRGVYFSINSICWAAGYFIGPPLGGWALDRSPAVAHNFWLALALSGAIAIAILQYLDKLFVKRYRISADSKIP